MFAFGGQRASYVFILGQLVVGKGDSNIAFEQIIEHECVIDFLILSTGTLPAEVHLLFLSAVSDLTYGYVAAHDGGASGSVEGTLY